jgi:hypothetical protein
MIVTDRKNEVHWIFLCDLLFYPNPLTHQVVGI